MNPLRSAFFLDSAGAGEDARGQGQPGRPLPPAEPPLPAPMKGAEFLLQRPTPSTRVRPRPAVWPLQCGWHRAVGAVLVLPVIQSFVPFLSDPTGGAPRCSGTGKVPGAVMATPENLELAAFQTADTFGIFQQWAFSIVGISKSLQLQAMDTTESLLDNGINENLQLGPF